MQKAKKIKTMLSWSSGKDSAYTLHQLRQDPNIELVGYLPVSNRTKVILASGKCSFTF